MMSASSSHPSIGRPVRWVVVGNTAHVGGDVLGPDVARAANMSEAGGDAIVMDWMAASYIAPGVMPRRHAVVVRARDQRPQGHPAFVVVTAAYSTQRSERPAGIEMARREGEAVGDAIVIARSIGVVLDTVIVDWVLFEMLAHNEGTEVGATAREFLARANAAMDSTTR